MIVAPGTELCKDGEIIFTGTEQVPCPICGGELKVHGTCKRKLETEDGENLLYRLRVMECKQCGRTHRELPAGRIAGYKHKSIPFLVKISEAKHSEHLKYAETSTWCRICLWMSWFLRYTQMIQESLILRGLLAKTKYVGKSIAGQTAYFVRLVTNSGNWVQQWSAQTNQ